MRFKILGLVALAALVAGLGTIGLSERQAAHANPLPIPTITLATAPNAGTNVFIVSGIFDEDDSCPTWGTTGCVASVSVTPIANVTSLLFAPVGTNPTNGASCTIDTNANGIADDTFNNCAVAPVDTNPDPTIFTCDTACAAALDANTVNNLWRLNLVLRATCLVDTVMTVTYTQDDGSSQAQFTCVGSAPKPVLAITKIDQNGALRGATFGLGTPNFATVSATMVTSSTNPATNPCLSTNNCATNPNTAAGPGELPPDPSGGIVLPVNVTLEVREIGAPSNCTLVEIKLGGATSTTVLPLSFPVQIRFDGAVWNVSSNGVAFGQVPGTRLDLTYVNSCGIAGAATATGSSVAVVIGGGSFGLTNTTHVEIVPAPGSDDDARIDIRVRDSNLIPLENAHVTVMTDRGVIALRAVTTGPAPTGYDVIEPSPASVYFGSNIRGDTCEQFPIMSTTAFSGNLTTPLIATTVAGNQIQDGYTNNDGVVSACLYVHPDMAPGITPGRATITVIVENPNPVWASVAPGLPFAGVTAFPGVYGPANFVMTATVAVVGPPASIKVAASPTSVQCGEKSTITATVTDSVGQNVSDHTRIELVSNFGATIGGTGATLGFPGTGPVNPISSSAAETFSGVATAFLLTSTEHVGPYEVVVASGGSTGLGNFSASTVTQGFLPYGTASVGVFSTAPVSAQVTVTCALPGIAVPIAAAPIASPRLGEGIRPPNTGDAGLADASGGSWAFVLAGALVFALAGVASVKFARR